MARLNIDTGTLGNPATGDTLRTAMTKINTNFEELYQGLLSTDDNGGLLTTTVTNGDMRIQPNGSGIVEIDTLKITDDDITSLNTNGTISITGNGTGGVDIEALTFNGTSISSTDSSRINLNENVTVDGDLIVTGSITGTFTVSSLDADSSTVSNLEVDNFKASAIVLESEGISSNDNDTTLPTSAAVKDYVDTNSVTASETATFTNKTFDANGTGNSISNLEVADFAAASIVTEAEGIGNNDNDTTIPTSAAVKDYVDARDIGDLSVTGSTISAPSNADLTLTTSGTGSVSIDGIQISGTEISSSDSTQVTIKENLHVTGNITGTLTGSVAFSNVTSTPTTIAGYGITDAASSTATALTVVGDDSSGTAVTLGETFKVAGATGITTAVSGDTLTITGPTLTGDLTFVGSTIISPSNADITLDPAGTGNVIIRTDKITLGNNASAGANGVAIGKDTSGVGSSSVAVGVAAGYNAQGSNAVAVGEQAGEDNQGNYAVAIGPQAGHQNQSATGVAIGYFAGGTNQGTDAVAIGQNAGLTGQGNLAIGIGEFAGSSNQGENAIAIGEAAGKTNQAANSIVINASGSELNNTTASSLVVKPIRNASGTHGLEYNPTTGEVTYDTLASGGATGDITFTGSTIQSPSNADITLDPSGTGGVVAQGPVTFNAGYIEKINTLTSSSTITVNCALASIHTVTLGTNTEFNITNLPTGGTVTLIITQDGTGTRTATFGTDGSSAVKFPSNSSTLSTGGGDIDVVTIINDGTNFLGNIAKDYRSS